MPKKTNTEYAKDFVNRHKDAGRTELRLWAKKENHKKVRDFAKQIDHAQKKNGVKK